jgi:Gas vesicle synthesis protein GvpL/GvpF
MPAWGRYLVAVSRGLDPSALAGVRAIRDSEVAVVECEGLQAVVCEVDLDEFGEEPLRSNLENLVWVEQMARAHHAAVCAVDAVGTTVPMRFATIYESDDRVAEQMRALRDGLTEALDRVEGAAEWSVKAYAALETPGRSDQPPAQSGAAYLMRKREAVEARRARERDDEECLALLHQRLATLARASRRLQLQDPRLSGRQEPMRMNAAYLVAHEAADPFTVHASTALADRPDLRVEVEGPWPPYSFASLEPS